MYRDNGYLSTADKVDVLINTSTSVVGATTLGTINRAINLAPIVAANGWYQYTFTVSPTFSSATNYVFFRATSAYGNNIFIDDISISNNWVPAANNCGIDYISNVTFSSINRSSACDVFSPYATPNPTLTIGSTYTLSVSTGGDTEGARAWIDYNGDGLFNNAVGTELVLGPAYAGTNPATYTIAVTIPALATPGVTRLRARCNYGAAPVDATSPQTWGETEDYFVTIAPTGTVGPTAPPNDLCANAITLAIPSTTAGTTVNATLEAPAPPTCITTLGQPGVWYKVVGNGNQLGADLCTTSSWDSKLFVYTGTCGSWTCVTGNDDGGPLCAGASASVQWCSVPGVNYFILATGYSGSSAFNIAITQTVVAQPTVVVSASSTSICAGASTTLTASGASTYLWGGALGTTAAINVTPAATTIYTVTGTGGACTIPNVNTFTVTVNASPTITVNSGAVCAGTSFTMAPSGGITYSYTGGSAIVTPTANTSYTVTSANASGCIGSAVSSVTVNPLPLVVVNSGAICAGNSFTMAPTGASSYTYSSGSAVVSPTANTTYTVTGESVGCVTTSSAVSTVTVNALPTLTVNSGVICTGGSFTITPSGASTYTYSGGSAVVSPTANASYTVTGTSTLGCVGSSVSSVTVGTIPTITVNNGTICSGYSFTMVPSGASTYSYSSGSAVVSPTANASYTVTGTSALGCAASNTAVSSVTVNASPEISASTSTSLICVGESAVLTASTTATTYTWNSGATTLTLSVSPTVTTTYSVSTTGSNGCVGNANVTVNVNACTSINEMYVNSISVYPNPNTGILNINLTSELAHNSTLEVYDALGKLVVKHSLDNELNTLNISNLTNGIYTFKVLNNSNLVKVGKLIKQ
jgi:hypothetical protein